MSSMEFCDRCSNLLYPKVDRTNHILMWECRNCMWAKEAVDNKMVYRNDLMAITKEHPGVTKDLKTDPTLARTKKDCPDPMCGSDTAIMFQDQGKREQNRMILFYVCTACERQFRDEDLFIGR